MTKVTCISDIHGFLPEIEPTDILICAGDFTPVWSHNLNFQIQWLRTKFKEWINSLPIKIAIFVPGNHDMCFELVPHLVPKDKDISDRLFFLNNDIVQYDRLKIYGSAYQLPFGYGWAFNAPEEKLKEIYDKIPEDTDIIISHGPPYGHGDITPQGTRAGSKELLDTIERIEPQYLICGHLHSGYGLTYCGPTMVINAALLNEDYVLCREPITFEI